MYARTAPAAPMRRLLGSGGGGGRTRSGMRSGKKTSTLPNMVDVAPANRLAQSTVCKSQSVPAPWLSSTEKNAACTATDPAKNAATATLDVASRLRQPRISSAPNAAIECMTPTGVLAQTASAAHTPLNVHSRTMRSRCSTARQRKSDDADWNASGITEDEGSIVQMEEVKGASESHSTKVRMTSPKGNIRLHVAVRHAAAIA